MSVRCNLILKFFIAERNMREIFFSEHCYLNFDVTLHPSVSFGKFLIKCLQEPRPYGKYIVLIEYMQRKSRIISPKAIFYYKAYL